MKLTPLLSDSAVVQRHQPIPVWGWTDAPRTRVRAVLADAVAEGISGDDGRFRLLLPACAAGGPHTLDIAALNGRERIRIRDILIGDVWLASGQSNMEWTMAGSEYHDAIRAANPNQVRMFTVARRADFAPQSTVVGCWECSTPDTVGRFSAVATFFGNRLQNELGIPVGIIHASWGGSFIETWISREALRLNPLTRDWVADYESYAFSTTCWEQQPDRFWPADPGNSGVENSWHTTDYDDSRWAVMRLPSTWQARGHDYSAVMWFRRRFTLPEAFKGRELALHLGAVDKQDITYAGGVEVGRTGEGFDDSKYAHHRHYRIPADLTCGEDLLIAVRAYSFKYAGGLTGPAESMRCTLVDDDSASVALDGDWRFHVEHNFGFIDMTLQGMGHGVHNSPYMCFENMIAPLMPIGLAGVIWYQGESNAGQPDRYRILLPELIRDWRRRFAVGALPFGIVQLANYLPAQDFQDDSAWAQLRDSQAAALSLPDTGLAVIIDRGDAADIHPRDKQTVGIRLAQWALAAVYGRAIPAGSPLYDGYRIEGNRIRVLFRNTGEGLRVSDGDRVRTLVIAGRNGTYKAAQSRIEGAALLVWHDDIPDPRHVRYAWADNPEGANLVNSIGYPAGPFRTDAPTDRSSPTPS